MEWIDATSYSRGERGTKPPASWEASPAGCRVWVSCDHRDWRPQWVLTCRELDIDIEPMKGVQPGAESADAAQREALALCLRAAENKVARMRSLREAFAFHLDSQSAK